MNWRMAVHWCRCLLGGFSAFERVVVRTNRSAYVRGQDNHPCRLKLDHEALCDVVHGHRGDINMLREWLGRLEKRVDQAWQMGYERGQRDLLVKIKEGETT
jgi:hypothetical protein